MIRLLLTVLLMSSFLSTFAQKIKKVEGECVYHAPENVTLEEAKRTALDRAKIQALINAFGTIVSQTSTTRMEKHNGHTSIDLARISESEVRGEWIETIDEPAYQICYAKDMLVVICKVKGKAREIVTAQIDFKAKILRNGTEDKYESDQFKSGDDLYLSFQSPVSGYLAVYLVDANRQSFCLLPYRNQTEGIYAINSNQQYVFFDIKSAPQHERPFVDEYTMTCDRKSEYNQIYAIFSPHQFAKAIDIDGNSNLPRELGFEDFQKWLVKCRRHDKDMNLRVIPLTITK